LRATYQLIAPKPLRRAALTALAPGRHAIGNA
jgi:hypothetical protein